ncbi:MAG: hypothetical protein PHR16_08740 [Methylovulum sp.]|nr:hypothetical protein [Methylovulum sp.]
MRLYYFVVVTFISILDIAPIPVFGLLLMWVIVFRPQWFYDVVLKIYGKQ